ncbi:MAG: hypothetical protein NZ898_08825, partial [Myxococcota bacterium]|nr:hypothetical protein [Myxococcota bacterium]
MRITQRRVGMRWSTGFGRLGVLFSALLGVVLGGAEAAARVQHAVRAEDFARDGSGRAMRLGPMRGDPRGAVDAGLRAAFLAAVQRNASEHFWGLQPRGPGRWRAREDGAGFELDERGV